MKRIQIKLRELRNADVTFVSLVDRAASRIPFRVMKKESGMIDLANPEGLMRALKQDQPEPKVSGIVVYEYEDEAKQLAVKQALEDAGFKTDKVIKSEGTLLYAQDESPLDGAEYVRTSDHMVLVVKGLDAYADDLRKNGTFNDSVNCRGFYPGISTAYDGMQLSMSSLLQDGEAGVAVKSEAKNLLTQFGNYVLGLVSALPAKAFKADMALQDLLGQSESGNPSGIKTQDEVSTMQKQDLTQAPEGISAENWSATPDAVKETILKMAGKEECSPEEKKRKEEEAAAASAKKSEVSPDIAALTELVTKQGETIATLAETVQKLQGGIDEAVRKSEDAVTKLGAVVTAAPTGGDLPAGAVVKKSEDDPRSGAFDTAFIRRGR